MTLKSIEQTFLSEQCLECNGDGAITVGSYDNEEVVECICKKEERLQKEADGLEGANIVAD